MNLPLNISALSIPLPPASPQFIDLYRPGIDAQAGQATAQELTDGLTATAASVSPKFFYNELGSKLFEASSIILKRGSRRQRQSILDFLRSKGR